MQGIRKEMLSLTVMVEITCTSHYFVDIKSINFAAYKN